MEPAPSLQLSPIEGERALSLAPPTILLPQPQRRGTFIQRLNRFAVAVAVDGEPVVAHLPNSGRMLELLVPGHPVVLMERPGPLRKTHYDMLLVHYQGHWVSVDSRLPSALAAVALQQGAIPAWSSFSHVRREATYYDSRLDLELTRPATAELAAARCLIETKSVNLVEDGRALFPDAPTLRGARHLRALTHALSEGIEAGVLFVIQREDARSLSPYDAADPDFGRALREAVQAGVIAQAWRCHVSPEAMTLDCAVPIEL